MTRILNVREPFNEGGVYIPPAVSDPDPNNAGFIPLVGDCWLFQGVTDAPRPSAFHLLDRPLMPVYAQADRDMWPGNTPPNPANGAYKALGTYPLDYNAAPMATIVRMPDLKASVVLTPPTLGAGARVSVPIAVPGARPGDLVTVSFSSVIPAEFVVTAAAGDDAVDVTLWNTSGATVAGGGQLYVTLAVAGGPFAGGPQPYFL